MLDFSPTTIELVSLPRALASDMNMLRFNSKNKIYQLELRGYPGDTMCWEIKNLYIEPRYRRQKYGTAIVRALQTFCRANAASLKVDYPFPDTVGFWQKMGFEMHRHDGIWSPT